MDSKNVFVYIWSVTITLIILCSNSVISFGHWKENHVTVCTLEEQIIKCPAHASIVIKQAEYGHIGISKCVEWDTGHFGCKVDASQFLEQRCSGKQSCTIDGTDPELRQANPCRKGLDVFIEMTYICMEAIPLVPCQPQMVTSKPSYISSRQTSVGSCNSQAHIGGTQFFFKTTPGQQLQFSMLRLSTTSSSSGRHNHTATQVGYIVDEGQDEVYPIELNHRRQTMHPLLKSTSNEVTVSLLATEHQHFLILVQAFGCQDLKPPKGDTMLIERHGDTTVVSYIILMTIVGLTVVLALVIVTVGYVCYKRSMESIGMEPLLDVAEYNKAPALPTKRGSTLLRGTLHRQSMAAEAPVPPPLRTNPQDLNNATIKLNHPQTVNLL
ncbi:hypothetical protein CAPTEDRAFT_227124 [Capitella teleta]|uniref:SUEL-type lectin domain-containing protein n=1 Tax=Capitella teleta TaxID=283909 RepID=R7V0R5_CAPTE|nr:hypothetical protein CAPTEDRAFT_227124 [Capitella teleta]|eukprot:ELU12092.1 hypothetical protein CAPTEDRAFT_227124 [Capitella teleta]